MQNGLPSQRTVLMVNDHFHFAGGGDTSFEHEREVYQSAGYRVCTFSCEPEAERIGCEVDTVHRESRFHAIRKTAKFTFNPRVFLHLRRVLKRLRPSFVKLHLVTKYPSSVYAALRGYPVAQVLHGPFLFCAGWGALKTDFTECACGVGLKCYTNGCIPLHRFPLVWGNHWVWLRLALSRVDLFVAPSRHIRATALAHGLTPVAYVPHALTSVFCDAHVRHDRTGPPTVVYAGALSPQKGVHVLMDAFALVKRELPAARLVIAGKGPMRRSLEEQAQELSVADSVRFLGFVEHRNMVSVYRSGHVFAMPSLWKEQFGLVGAEALACGTPCVASNTGGIREWLQDGQSGFLVPPGDAGALAQKLLVLLQNPGLRERFGTRGREFVLREYGWEAFRRRTLQILQRFLGDSSLTGTRRVRR